jgi:transcriptional regulator
MYIPPPFLVTDRETICDFIERSPFATLVSATGGVPAVSHLPLFLDEKTSRADNDSEPHRGDEDGALHLLGHFARENSHCERADGQNVLAVFHGPHSYISPAWYKSKNVVPTWNYQAVHATGTLELIEDPVAMLHLLSRTVDQFPKSSTRAPRKSHRSTRGNRRSASARCRLGNAEIDERKMTALN